MKPRIFIGSSTEGLEVAENLNLRLSKDCETVPWNGGAFGVSETYIGSLEKALEDVEFAVLIVPALTSRDVSEVFELLKKGVRQYRSAKIGFNDTVIATNSLLPRMCCNFGRRWLVA